jgi:polyisoprenoid-binding protein YceI
MRFRRRLKWGSGLLLALLALVMGVSSGTGAAGEAQQLIVFVQPGASEVDTGFREQMLPEIKKLASSVGVAVHVLDARKGAPPEVTITPLMVYQNYRGRSVYQGRTNTLGRLRNFIRTSRFVPQGNKALQRNDIPIWRLGRTRIWSPLKVSGVTGAPPSDYDQAEFVSEAIRSITRGFSKYRMDATAELGRSDRGFYMDFYPWRSQDGSIYLSLALFSQFHCKEPVYHTGKQPLVGPWEQRDRLFREAAAVLEAAVSRCIQDPQGGDGFDPIPSDAPEIDWNALGFPLPAKLSEKTEQAAPDVALTSLWFLEKPGLGDPPMIQFHFPAPLDNYAGEVKDGTGELQLPEDLQLAGSQGFIEIDTRSAVTMGDPALDEAIRGSMILYVKKYPTARFEIESISSDGQPIDYGRLTPAQVRGILTLKGKSMPLAAIMEAEPVIADDGLPRLLLRGAFTINLMDFDIEGADGPAPARHTLMFDVNFKLKPGTLTKPTGEH